MTELELKNKGFKKISNYFENLKDYYWVDCNGNVFTTNLDRFIIPAKDRDGYLRCTFTTATGTPRTKVIGVHQLVNTIFNGMAPESIYQPVTDHIDGDRTNNKHTNLRWLSNRANASFAYRHLGKKTIITDDDVIEIYKKYRNGFTNIYKLAEEYNTTYKYMYGILSGAKRRTVCDLYHVEPPIKPEKMIDAFDVWEIAFKLLSNPSPTQISRELDIPVTKIKHIKDKDAWALYTENFDFINQTTSIFDESEDIFVTNDLEKIGETEYFVPSDWNDNEVGISDIL